MLFEWLQRPHVKEWWDDGDDTLDKVISHYSPDSKSRKFIAEISGEAKGYFQYYKIDRNHFGADQFLANERDLSRGMGTACLTVFVQKIIDIENVENISVDPHPDNLRAIRCYEKCGFLHDVAKSKPGIHCMTKYLEG